MLISRRGLIAGAPATALMLANRKAFAQAAGKKGGDIIVGIGSPIPSLDIMGTTDDVGRIINLHLYEALVTRDEKLQPSAGLAESWEISPDGLTYTFKLRKGVKFHNGKEMTATDVKASIERYQRMSLRRRYLDQIAEVSIVDPVTVAVKLKAPQPLFLNNFSQPEVLVAILPAEDGDKDPGKTSFIGTGPYKLVENKADSHVKLARFDDYALDTRYPGPSGYGGRKDALFDTLTFRIIAEPSAMVAAIETGEIHLADLVPEHAVPGLKNNAALTVINRMPTAMQNMNMNMAVAPMDKLPFRQAIASILDMDEILAGASDGNYRLNPYLQYPGYPLYPEGVKAPLYNIKNAEKAKKLVAESGYKDEVIQIIGASTFPWHSNTALIVSEQLKSIGIKTQIETMDWPAVVALRVKKTGWSLNPGQFGTGPWLGDPVLSIGDLGGKTSANNVEDPVLAQMVADMQLKPTAEERKEAWYKAQQHIIDNVLSIKLGDIGQTQVRSNKVVGFTPFRTTRLWGVSFA
ncbi:ABC transporter substrate-binding protein [Chelatococcus asaccharovorans]|uniref:ABC transporter substrate-binding protein n=1 Tax=Chelatococcus asaccharovorans TaxID=28210 RepID=UPI00224C6D9F|nr:ABC transporter substrate-binding protein [Chelatococcus asaccharovorans]CAH1662359.1 Peptide/nickel transport system substrate-binding protein [Chelatococcus asaccharovorans]CAH1683195.1 Peptide/nickel transport system substrate-binding protein [Chelatococcus asaccharovorans]